MCSSVYLDDYRKLARIHYRGKDKYVDKIFYAKYNLIT